MKYISTAIFALAFTTAPLAAQDIPLSQILVKNEGWREVAKGVPDVSLLEAQPTGSISIFKRAKLSAQLGTEGKLEMLKPPAEETMNRNQSAVRSRSGAIYGIAWGGFWVDFFTPDDKRGKSNLPGLKASHCLTLWPDDGHLVIGEADGAYLWAVRIEKDGSLGPGDRYYSLRTKPNEKMHVTAMTMDAGYLLYACTPLGIQVFDPTGRLSGVIAAPSKDTMTAITIGGEKADTLFVAAGDKIYARKIQGKASYTLKKEK